MKQIKLAFVLSTLTSCDLPLSSIASTLPISKSILSDEVLVTTKRISTFSPQYSHAVATNFVRGIALEDELEDELEVLDAERAEPSALPIFFKNCALAGCTAAKPKTNEQTNNSFLIVINCLLLKILLQI